MTVFARSDVAAVAISPEHGGCGQPHSRPVGDDGTPAALWVLTCHGGCEDVLRADPLWASTVAEIPETPDEKTIREDWDKRGASDQQYVQAMALAKLAHLDIPESLTRVVGAVRAPEAALAAVTMDCPHGHTVPVGRFCAECGAPLAGGQQLAEIDTTETDLDAMLADGEPVEVASTAANAAPAASSATEHVCKECGKPVHRKGGKGRWPTRCDDCATAG
jgi:ribosomal protein L37AE/L43A